MPISEREVARLARLANLELDPEETARLTRDLGAILEYAERLPAFDDADSADAPLVSSTPLRDDIPGPALEAGLAVSVAPDRQGNLYKVPPVLGGESSSKAFPGS
jgi:aspartyl-tRNA(Asn)/glutamyl-tRNA(Gln) amidotransferase subunit C